MASYSTPRVLGEALYILDGNVGLGTTLPRSVLDIQSTLPVVINTTAGVGIGTVQPVVSFEVHSTDSFLLPKGTTQDRPQGIHGYVRYNTDTQQFEGFGAGDAWGTLGGTKDVNQDTYISAETFPGSNDDALRFITCNIERMRIDSQGNIGIGTNLTDAKIDIYASNETVGLRLRQDGTGDVFNIWGSNNSLFTMLANGNIGIGTVQPKDTFHVETGMYASNAFTSNLVIWNSLYVPLTATRLRTRIQVHHIRKSFYVSEPTQSIFTVEYPGAFTGHQSNVQVFLGRNQLSYVSPTVKDYDLTVTYNMPSLQTEYNVTLLRPAKYGDIVDIIVWPQITQDSPEEQGIVYQGVQVNDSYWLEQDKDLPIRSNVPIYVLGDVGIGTTQPNAKLDIYGNIQIKGNIIPHTCNVYNLGHPDYRFKDIYLSGNTIDIGGTTITRDTDTGGLNILSDQGVPLDTSVRNLYTSANIGVGMSNPAYPLDVAGSAQFAGHVLPASNLIYDLGSSNQRFKDVYLSGNTIDLDGTLLRKHVTGPLMVMSSSNNELQMQSTITRHIYVEGTAHSSNTIITGYDPSKTTLDVHENSSATIATFRNASNTVLLLQNDGNLGIGTISPSSTLTVSGNISIGAYAEISAPPQGMILSGNLGVGTTQPGSALSVLDGVSIGAYAGTTAPTQGMILSGNLGVGTTQPGSALSVLDGVSIGAYAGTTAPPQGMIVSGNIGINTPQPMYPLHIEGNLYASGTVFASNLQVLGDFVRMDTVTSNTEQMVITNDGTGPALTVTQKGAQPIADFYDDSDVLTMRVADNGNVGIGTSTPTQKLDVEGTVKATLFSGSGASLTSLNADQITTGTVVVSRGGTGSNILTANKVLIGNGTDGILQPTLLHWDNTNSRLGIGTISPNNSLHIYDNASVSAIVVDQRGTGNIAEFLDASVKKVVIDGSGNVGIGTQTPLHPLDVYASSTVPTLVVDQRGTGNIAEFLNAGTKKVIIDGTGNVGIGTQNPITPVHTIGTILSQINGTHSTGETANGVHSFIAYAPGGTTANASIWMGYDPTADCGYINSARSGTTRPVCLQTRGGSVGIGTTNPRSIVDIFGDVNITGNIGNGTYIYDAYTKATNYTSINGGHGSDTTTQYWHSYLHFSENDGRIGFIYNNSSGDTLGTEWVEYAVPSGMKQGWLAHLPWTNCRYFDVYGKKASGTLMWLFRVNNYHAYPTNDGADHNGVSIIPICAVDFYTHIRISAVRGRYHLLGFAWSKHDRQHNNGGQTGFVSVDNIYGPGAILQVVERRTEARGHYSAPPSGNGTLTDIYVDIVPIRSNSKILLQFMVNGEMHQDAVYLVHRSIAGAASVLIGYNTNRGNVRHSGVAASDYDQNEDSTPQTKYISWSDSPGTVSSVRYYIAVRSSSGGTYTFAQNGVLNGTHYSNGADAYEITVSNAIAKELWVA